MLSISCILTASEADIGDSLIQVTRNPYAYITKLFVLPVQTILDHFITSFRVQGTHTQHFVRRVRPVRHIPGAPVVVPVAVGAVRRVPPRTPGPASAASPAPSTPRSRTAPDSVAIPVPVPVGRHPLVRTVVVAADTGPRPLAAGRRRVPIRAPLHVIAYFHCDALPVLLGDPDHQSELVLRRRRRRGRSVGRGVERFSLTQHFAEVMAAALSCPLWRRAG